MSELVDRHELVSVPSYALLTLRDQYVDAPPNSTDLIRRANVDVVAADEYELFICCAQDLLKISARLDVWSARPPEVGAGWSAPQRFALECRNGVVALGSPTGAGIDVRLRDGPGLYGVEVVHCGRERAGELRGQVLRSGSPNDSFIDVVDAFEASDEALTEQYWIRMWWQEELPEEEDEDED